MVTKVKQSTKELEVRKKMALQVVKTSGGSITPKDVDLYTGTSGLRLYGITCPSCGRKRQIDMALIFPCPGKYGPKTGRSLGGCNDTTFMKAEIKKDYENKKEESRMKMKERKKKKVEKEPVESVSKKKGVTKKKIVKKKAVTKKKPSMCATIRELALKGKTREQIIKMTGANPSTVSIQRAKALREAK